MEEEMTTMCSCLSGAQRSWLRMKGTAQRSEFALHVLA
jgi:hypothetical protein